MDSSLSAKIHDSRNCQRINCASCSTNAPILAQAYLALSAKADKLLAAAKGFCAVECLEPWDKEAEDALGKLEAAIKEYEGKERGDDSR